MHEGEIIIMLVWKQRWKYKMWKILQSKQLKKKIDNSSIFPAHREHTAL